MIIAWADGETVQHRYNPSGEWFDLVYPNFDADGEFRVKPNMMNINGYDVPAPHRWPLMDGQVYYRASLSLEDSYDYLVWRNESLDKTLLAKGLIHLTKEAAIQHTKALLSFTTNNGSQE